MNDVLQVLLAAIDEAYERHGWQGTTLHNAVRRAKADEVYWRPGPGRHNIWELTAHAAYWKYVARRRLAGGVKRGSFALKGSNWFASPVREDEAAWREVVALLEAEHGLWREAVVNVDAAVLRDRKKVRLIYGATAHDVYHTGQIQLIKACFSRRSAS